MRQWEEIKYDAKLRLYRPHILSTFVTFCTKKDAQDYCRENKIPQKFTTKIGNRFCSAWGLMDDHGRFLMA